MWLHQSWITLPLNRGSRFEWFTVSVHGDMCVRRMGFLLLVFGGFLHLPMLSLMPGSPLGFSKRCWNGRDEDSLSLSQHTHTHCGLNLCRFILPSLAVREWKMSARSWGMNRALFWFELLLWLLSHLTLYFQMNSLLLFIIWSRSDSRDSCSQLHCDQIFSDTGYLLLVPNGECLKVTQLENLTFWTIKKVCVCVCISVQ